MQVSAVFRTSEEDYKVAGAGLIIPVDSTPAKMSALINHLLDRSDDPAEFSFFIQGVMISGSLKDILESLGHSYENQVTIEYSLAKELPEEKRQDQEPDWVRSVRASDDGICLTGSFDSLVRLYDMKTGKPGAKTFFSGHTSCVTSLAWLSSTNFVSGSNDRTLRIWDVEDPQSKAVLQGHEGTIQSLTSASGLIVSGDYEGKIGFWSSDLSLAMERLEVKPSKKKKRFSVPAPVSGPVIEAKAFVSGHADGPVTSLVCNDQVGLLSAGYDHLVKCWDFESMKAVKSWRTGSATSTMAASGSTVLVANPDGTMRLLDTRTNSLTQKTVLHEGWINGLAWSPASEHLFASTGADLRVGVWDLRGLGSGPVRVLSEGRKRMLGIDWSGSGIYFGGEGCTLHTCT